MPREDDTTVYIDIFTFDMTITDITEDMLESTVIAAIKMSCFPDKVRRAQLIFIFFFFVLKKNNMLLAYNKIIFVIKKYDFESHTPGVSVYSFVRMTAAPLKTNNSTHISRPFLSKTDFESLK